MDAATVRVICIPTGGAADGVPSGSGFVVGRAGDCRHVVTNWHVVACAAEGGRARVLLGAGAGKSIDMRVPEHDEDRDLAVLAAEGPLDRPPVHFASVTTALKRDRVWAVGFPGAADKSGGADPFDPSAADGVISRIAPKSADPTAAQLVQHSVGINPGNSGGPLYDDHGRVIGINTLKSLTAVLEVGPDGKPRIGRVPLGEGIGWAVAADELFPLLKRLRVPYEVDRDRPGLAGDGPHREPLTAAALGLSLLLSATALGLAASRRGRTAVRETVTRAFARSQLANQPAKLPTQADVAPMGSPPVPRAGIPRLRGIAGPYAGVDLPLADGPIAIGRDPALVQLVLPASAGRVSKRHALVAYDAGRRVFTVEDCWSTHGTLVNGAAIASGRPVTLQPGQRFQLASPEIAFEVGYA